MADEDFLRGRKPAVAVADDWKLIVCEDCDRLNDVIYDLYDEIEQLRAALKLAAIDVFAQCDPLTTSPNQLVQHYIDEGRR